MRRDARQLLLDHALDVRLGAVGQQAELGRDGVCAEERRHDVDRSFLAELPGDLDQPQLSREVKAVAGLRLDGGNAAGEHLVEPAAPVPGEVVGVSGARHRDGREDPTAGGEDLEVAGPALAEHQLLFARAREQQVRVGVDEPGRDDAAVRVQSREPGQCVAAGLQPPLDRRPRPNADDASLPARHDRGIGRTRTANRRRVEDGGVGLGVASPQPPGERRDLRGAVDQEAGCVGIAAATFDEPQRHASPPTASRAAARRSSSAMSGEASRSLMAAAAAANRSSSEASSGASA